LGRQLSAGNLNELFWQNGLSASTPVSMTGATACPDRRRANAVAGPRDFFYAWLTEADDERARKIALIDEDRDDSIEGECFDKVGIARAFGMTPYAVTEALRRGAPYVTRGTQTKPWRINPGDFMRWQIKDACGLLNDGAATQASIYHAEKTRKMAAEADRIEWPTPPAKP
jgi:hypothetical protein